MLSVALTRQIRVLGVGISREWGKHLHGSGMGVFGELAEPVMHILFMGGWYYLLGLRPPVGSSPALFIATGLYASFLFVHFAISVRAWTRLSAASSRFSSETSLDLILSKAFVWFSLYICSGVLIFAGLAILVTPEAIPYDPLRLFSSVASVAVFGLGMGMINAVLELLLPFWKYLWGPLTRVFIHLSGMIFVADLLPPSYRTFFALNPILHAVISFRLGFWPNYPSLVYIPGYNWYVALVALAIGLCVERVYRYQLER